jgi:hypothetical protein
MAWWPKVERREAPRPTSLGARGSLAARGGYVNPASKGTRWCPGASRRSIPSRKFARDWQTSDAWRRENEAAWLFAIVNHRPVSRTRCSTKCCFAEPGSYRNAGALHGPGSAAHRSASTARCAASGERGRANSFESSVVVCLQRMLRGRNTDPTFGGQPGRVLRAPLFSHTAPCNHSFVG